MRQIKSTPSKIFLLYFIFILSLGCSLITAQDIKSRKENRVTSINPAELNSEQKSGKVGDEFMIDINNIRLPMNSRGILADVGVGNNRYGGFFDNNVFLFSSGFYLGGVYHDDSEGRKIWTLANATSSRNVQFLPGTWQTGEEDPRAQIYVVRKSDTAFGESWQDWKDAVALGADFYDGDNDGTYNPVDKNNNGEWDENEDKPGVLGDITAWTTYHDRVKPEDKHGYEDVPNMGINMRQTIYGFKSKGKIGNALYIKYEIENTGKVASVLDSVYFGKWGDPDIGNYEDDLTGSAPKLNAGYDYDRGTDLVYGNSPAFMFDIMNGPVSYVPGESFIDNNGNGIYDEGSDTPLDTAKIFENEITGFERVPGAKNLKMSSFIHYISSHPTRGDPNDELQAYNYLKGLSAWGDTLNPCDNNSTPFSYYNPGAGCDKVNPFYWFSGDPVADTGWICDVEHDQRMLANTGPFQLRQGEPVEIIVGYFIGRNETSLASVDSVKQVSSYSQALFDANFEKETPPTVEPAIVTTENTIKLIWETPQFLNWSSVLYDEMGNKVYDLRFEGFEVNMYSAEPNLDSKDVQKKTIARYDVRNEIYNIFRENPATGDRLEVYPTGTQLSPQIYGDPKLGRIKLEITEDPFTGKPLIKDKSYFISITAYGVNHEAAEDFGEGRTVIPESALIGLTSSETGILGDDPGIKTGRDLLDPLGGNLPMEKISGYSEAEANYNIIDRQVVKPHTYEITFDYYNELTENYSLLWQMKDMDENRVVIDSVVIFEESERFFITDGIEPLIEWIEPGIDSIYYEGDTKDYFTPLQDDSLTGVHYMGKDFKEDKYPYAIKNFGQRSFSEITKAYGMRRVEIRFDEPGKAYRFVRPAKLSIDKFIYPNDAYGKGRGFIEVPFSAYVKDYRTGEEKRLAVGYLETYPSNLDSLGYPDEKWNPYTDLEKSREYIVVFNSLYDEQGGNIAYTGLGNEAAYLESGFELDTTNAAVSDSLAEIAASPWHDALYLIGLEAKDSVDHFDPEGKFVVEPVYPLTEKDKFRFSPKMELTKEEKKDLFDKVNVYPNPLMGYNPRTAASSGGVDNQFVTFINLPEEVTIKIFTLSGNFVRELTTADKSSSSSPTLQWNLRNKAGRKVASGMYLAIVESPGLGEKVLKLGILMPGKIEYKIPVE